MALAGAVAATDRGELILLDEAGQVIAIWSRGPHDDGKLGNITVTIDAKDVAQALRRTTKA